jgi:hypothetical protein
VLHEGDQECGSALKEVFLEIPLSQTLPDVLHNGSGDFNKICMVDYIVKRIVPNYLHANVSTAFWIPQGIRT